MADSVGALVLVVDGDSTIRAKAVRALRTAGFQPLEAASLAQARPMLRAPLHAVAVADKLPDGAAADLIEELQVPVIILAGKLDASHAVALGACEMIDRKNVSDELVGAIGRALAPPEPSKPAGPPPLPKREPMQQGTEKPGASSPISAADEASLLAALREELSFLRNSSYYRVLGITADASQSDIEEAFTRFTQTWHADKVDRNASQAMRALAGEIYALGQSAHSVLANPARRSQYKPPRTYVPRKTVRPKTAAAKQQGPGKIGPPALPPLPILKPRGCELSTALLDDIDLPSPDSDEDPHIQAARTALREERRADARSELAAALATKPDSGPARALMLVVDAIDAQNQGRSEEAESALDQALAADSACLEALALKEQLEDAQSDRRHSVLHKLLPEAPASKSVVIDAIVLAFSRSEASAVVGTDALRMVLDVQFVALIKSPGTLDLQPLWKLLSSQPGFVADHAIPPLCRIKSWGPRLRYSIELPFELAYLGATERSYAAAQCKVSESELARVLDSTQVSPTRAAGGAAAARPRIQSAEVLPPEQVKKRKLGRVLVPLAVLAVAASLAITFSGGPLKVSTKQLSNSIPLGTARQSGEVVGAFLTDPAWLTLSEVERRHQVEEAFHSAEDLGASELLIMDSNGYVRAHAVKQGERTEVFFPTGR